jgi:hypothetical protein
LWRENPQSLVPEAILGALFWGTLFGHTTLAAVWSAFGPAPFLVRLPLALGWVAMLTVAVYIHVLISSGFIEVVLIIGACLFGQWLFLQFPLWGLAIGWGVRLQHCDDVEQPGQEQLQFTIRQLLVVTAAVGVVFGIGRVALPIIHQNMGGTMIFALLTAIELILTLPLVLAALLRRFAIPGVVLALVLIAVATAWEMPLLRMIGQSLQLHVLVAINAGTALILLSILAIVRFCGYSLSTYRASSKRQPTLPPSAAT